MSLVTVAWVRTARELHRQRLAPGPDRVARRRRGVHLERDRTRPSCSRAAGSRRRARTRPRPRRWRRARPASRAERSQAAVGCIDGPRPDGRPSGSPRRSRPVPAARRCVSGSCPSRRRRSSRARRHGRSRRRAGPRGPTRCRSPSAENPTGTQSPNAGSRYSRMRSMSEVSLNVWTSMYAASLTEKSVIHQSSCATCWTLSYTGVMPHPRPLKAGSAKRSGQVHADRPGLGARGRRRGLGLDGHDAGLAGERRGDGAPGRDHVVQLDQVESRRQVARDPFLGPARGRVEAPEAPAQVRVRRTAGGSKLARPDEVGVRRVVEEERRRGSVEGE